VANTITGSPVTYSAGGGGGNEGDGAPGPSGGSNSGSGGKGGGYASPGGTAYNGGAGGSGVVVIRAPGSAIFSVGPATNTVTTLPAPAGGCKVATFTVSGTLTT
jgi:hypothetical protein